MLTKKLAVIIIVSTVFGLILTAATPGVMGSPKANSGVTGDNLVIYADSKGTTYCTNIIWGNVNADSSITRTVYVKNPNNYKLTLTVSTSNWTPAESMSMISVSSDRNNYVLSPGKIVPVILTLTVGANTGNLTGFDCIIVFSGTK